MRKRPYLLIALSVLMLGARLVEIAEAGHLPQVESFPKYMRALLDFISGR